MADPLLFPDNAAAKLRQLDDRIRVLETSNKLLASTIRGGTLRVLSDSGTVVGIIGELDFAANGLEVRTPSGALILGVNDVQGFASPWLEVSWFNMADFIPVTSGTFVNTYRAATELVWSDQIKLRARIACDVGTTGEIQIYHESTASVLGGVKAVSATALTAYEFCFTHGFPFGNGPVWLILQVRRTSGAGNINVYVPSPAAYGSNMAPVAGGWL